MFIPIKGWPQRRVWMVAAFIPLLIGNCLAEDNKPSQQQLTLGLNANTIDVRPGRRGLSQSLQGNYPIHIPTYDGVEQLLVLSSRWIVLVTSNLEDVSREIETLALPNIETLSKENGLVAEHSGSATKPGFFLEWQKNWLKAQLTGEGTASGEYKKPSGHFDWNLNAAIQFLIGKYWVQAREKAGERLLDKTDYYFIHSDNDSNYQQAVNPKRATRSIVCRGGERVGGFDIDYAHYSYLEMPLPLVSGKTYTVTVGNGKKVSFLYDELRTVARTIKVNQVGYLPDVSRKYAYLSGWLQEYGAMDFSYAPSFQVIEAHSGDTVYKGIVKLREANPKYGSGQRPMCGEDVYELDISSLKSPGLYFISIPGVGRSWPFRVGKDIYGEAFYIAMRGMYAQRCGIPLTNDYSAWTRIQCHPDTGCVETDCPLNHSAECDWIELDGYMLETLKVESGLSYDPSFVTASTRNTSRLTTGPTYGWHDASDWQKRAENFSNILAMLTIYEMMPAKFTDGQLNIPESGNGIPDILDECEFGLRFWKKSMTSVGGVTGRWMAPVLSFISDPRFQFCFSRRTRWCSLLYAAAAAQYAQLVKPFNTEKSAEYEADAKLAYEYGINPANSLGTVVIHAKTGGDDSKPLTITWIEKDSYNLPYLTAAKLRLFLLTGDRSYFEADPRNLAGDPRYPQSLPTLLKIVPRPGAYPSILKDYFSFFYYGIFTDPMVLRLKSLDFSSQLSMKMAQRVHLEYFRDTAAWLTAISRNEPYRRAFDRDGIENLAWGEGALQNRSRWLLQAYYINSNVGLLDLAVQNMDYQLGGNPQGMVWTTGLGFVYPIHIQHDISEWDPIEDPFPGIAIYGPTNSSWYSISKIWQPKDSQGKFVKFLSPGYWNGDALELPPVLRRYASHPAFLTDQNEFTIQETLASNLFVLGFLMSEGWMPTKELKDKLPLDERLLFGYWYLP